MFLISCDPHMVYDQYMTIENGQWKWEDVGVFEVEMNDTISSQYLPAGSPYGGVSHEQPLYVCLLKGPSGQHLRDTVNMVLAAPDGRWIGTEQANSGSCSFCTGSRFDLVNRAAIPFTLEQAMRKSELPVTDVGVRIERIKSLVDLGKKKLKRFRELETLKRVFQPPFEEVYHRDYSLEGRWKQEVFGNDNPLILELGCGKGEYTVGLAG